MGPDVKIVAVELEADDGLLVTFSDGTTAGYVVEELLALRPLREAAKTSPTNVSWARSDPQKP